ncbi:hypothetical protein WGT02_22325 (plasmid) [Rhizobium sp. T1470]|uniref:hypothetical protein n=1 Tax=Rhizobium sp. T1473 TaxID=555321 RepID=UPI001CD5E8FE|nr:hypothetical protein [Rhizobium sp. T1473]MCA0804689.1 hypothetical protein [Rhizobium sp. T1473]
MIGALDVSLTPETNEAVGASDKAGSRDVVAMAVAGSGGRTVRGFAAGWEPSVELAVGVVAASNAKMALLSTGETVFAACGVCCAAAPFRRGNAAAGDPVSEAFTDPTAPKSAIGRSPPVDETIVAFTRRALPAVAAL